MNLVLATIEHQSVPAVRFARWQMVETAEGHAQSVLPLATEIHQGTHQAALMLLAEDYTGAIALASLLRGFSIAGIHPLPAQWPVDRARLAGQSPDRLQSAEHDGSARHLHCVIGRRVDRIRARFFAGEPTIVPLEVTMHAERMCVARAVLTSYVTCSSFIKPDFGIRSTER